MIKRITLKANEQKLSGLDEATLIREGFGRCKSYNNLLFHKGKGIQDKGEVLLFNENGSCYAIVYATTQSKFDDTASSLMKLKI